MKRILFLTFFTAICALSCVSVRAEPLLSVCINEICSSNKGNYTIKGLAPDYIELHTLTDQALPLDGLFISDDEDHLQKFSLDGYAIPENGFIILAADKKELPFKLSSSGEELFLSDKEGNILQHVTLPPLEDDKTYSLQNDGSWQITDPTPLAANAEGIPYVKTVYVASPRFSHSAGFYDDPFELTIEGYKAYRIYYTVDGSVPDENSALYTGPIPIDDATSSPNTLSMRTDITINGAGAPVVPLKKSTVIRAVAIDAQGNRSNVVTETYFVGFQNYPEYHDISILSIVADPFSLFDEDTGIYVLGKMYRDWLDSDEYSSDLRAYDRPRNYGQSGKEWEIPATIQYFDKDEKMCLSQNVGLRIHGNMTRENAQKAFNLYARKEYGESTFQYPLIDGVRSISKVVVRGQAGRDSLVHGLLQETGLPTSGCTPCLVFINGEFWGFYELREKQNEEYLSNLFGINEDALMVYKNYSLIAGADEKGRTSSVVYKNFVADIITHDPAADEGYAYACSKIDMDNYITYMAMILYCNNEDVRSNKTLWRTMTAGSSPYEDGRWRWIVQDMDGSIHRTDGVVEAIQIAADDELFMSLLKHPVFRRQFLTRIMDFANVELTPEYVEEYITPILNYYNQYFIINDQRWNGVEQGNEQISKQRINNIMSFFKKRKGDVIDRLQSILGIEDQVAAISVSPIPESLKLTVNGHTARLYNESWEGSYYIGSEVIFASEEIPGFRFLGWYEGDQLISEEKTIKIFIDKDQTFTPVFEELPTIICMDDANQFIDMGESEFSKLLTNSLDRCVIQPDPGVKIEAKRNVLDKCLLIRLDASVKEPQGFTLTMPLHYYLSCGVIFTVSVPDHSAPFTWSIRYRNSSSVYQSLPVDCAESSGGVFQLSCGIPKEQIDQQFINIRLEAEPANGAASFLLHSLKIYGLPMDDALAKAYEYQIIANSIGAPAQYIPDLDGMMAMWSGGQIEDEIVFLRDQLQTALTEKALTTVGALANPCPAWEGLEDYPAVVIDDNLIQAFYNQDSIVFRVPVGHDVYLYEALDGTLLFQNDEKTDGSSLSVRKNSGIFFILDRAVEEIRFHAAFDSSQIPDALLSSTFSNIQPLHHLWMDIEIFTQYQEEAVLHLPEIWPSEKVFVYRLENEALKFIAQKTSADDMLRFWPEAGRYLLLDDSLESYEQQAGLEEKIKTEMKQYYALENQRSEKMNHLLVIAASAFAAVFVIAIVVIILFLGKRK